MNCDDTGYKYQLPRSHHLRVLCPTMDNVARCARMLETLHRTARGAHSVVLCLEESDPELSKYVALGEDVVVSHSRTFSGAINAGFKSDPYYEWYHMTNDDVLYHTDGWDVEMTPEVRLELRQLHFPNDLQYGSGCATFPVLPGHWLRAAGWCMLPSLKRLHGDIVLQQVALEMKRLAYHDRVLVEHLHFTNGKRPPDAVNLAYNEDFATDKEVLDAWLARWMHPLIHKIKKEEHEDSARSSDTGAVP